MVDTGRRADLALLDADPYADIRNTRRIVWLMKQGEIVSNGPVGSRADGNVRAFGAAADEEASCTSRSFFP